MHVNDGSVPSNKCCHEHVAQVQSSCKALMAMEWRCSFLNFDPDFVRCSAVHVERSFYAADCSPVDD